MPMGIWLEKRRGRRITNPMLWILGSAGLAAAAALAYLVSDYRRRRLLYSSWRRLVRWEFWPMGVFYAPIALHILFLGLRRRCLTLFTAANPGIPHGGIALMSKSAILDSLSFDSGHIAAYKVIAGSLAPDEKAARLRRFMRERGLEYPIVLKPDFGERGKEVAFVRSREEADAYLRRANETVIAQERVCGPEFGVFYLRHPEQPKGRVISLTSKNPTWVEGDGKRTLERLILDDPRAVCMARFFLKKLAARLEEVPAPGERVVLAELGTHSRGSLFLDANDLWTPELEASVDALSRSFEGFHVGRYDVRAPSAEALRRGEGYKVLELNGVVSEPTHMYDPRHGLDYAYRAMFALWRDIFEIAAANRARGARPSTLRELRALLREYKRREAKTEGKGEGFG